MSILEIVENLFFIERGYLNGNHFVYRSQEPILVDTAYKADFAETRELITSLGVDLSTVRLIITTHSHSDHIGGNRIIQEASGCDIAMHKIGKYFSDTRDDWSTWRRYYDHEADFFDCTISLEDGDVVSIGPHKFQVIYTPGHASDGITLYHQQEKILISSDALWERDIPGITVRIEGSRALFEVQASLAKLKPLDVNMVYPGHGSPFADMSTAIQRSERKIETYLNDRESFGTALVKRMLVFALLRHQTMKEAEFISYVTGSNWFQETIDLYFDGNYRAKYNEIMDGLSQRGVVKRNDGRLFTIVKR